MVGQLFLLLLISGADPVLALARDNDFDVVLIDTAGRMQDNEVRFTALKKRRGVDTDRGNTIASYASSRQTRVYQQSRQDSLCRRGPGG
jgi:flagellar biosynthesis GTPase FlhF